MGHLLYDSTEPIYFDDRLLWHIKLVIIAKLRRQESFSFSWDNDNEGDGGLTCIWLHSEANLRFEFTIATEPDINRDWLEALMHSANSTSGLHVIPEAKAAEQTRGKKTAKGASK
ncbi:hypothetical protein B0I08_104190 [Glaciihabitans tibetensis]|uniref:DUF7882 domain-containing protein n=1 Tax=Glaciihabitans tibetensis TaxID=1266600 RepID=A0A2T0VE78_9MICO|nr:ATP-dependent DNA ligase [Glaciihabitans tibetensis]PRY68488.1 hypothetical protein B0I08_104190 [Glaciihabitans tibetensis]